MVQGGGAWNMVQPRHPRARARDPGGGPGRGGEGAGGGEGVGAGERGAGGRGAAAEARGRADRPQGERAGGGRGGREGAQGRGPQPRPSLPRANLEPRENTACLNMEDFQALPTEEEFVQWMEHKVFMDDEDVLTQVLEGF